MADQRRILITRLSHIGDCILTLPLAHAIKQNDPQAFIAWVVQPPTNTLLARCSVIDRVVTAKPNYLADPREVWRLRRELRTLDCNLVFDPQSLSKSAILGWLSGARCRIGLGGRYGKECAAFLNTVRVPTVSRHIVDRTMDMLVASGMRATERNFELELPAESVRWAGDFLAAAHLGCAFVAMNPGASWVSKRWPPRRFARVARHLGETFRLPSLVMWHGENELRWSKQIVEGSGGHAVLAPPTNLVQLACLLQKAHFFVGGDTGPLHLAAAVGTACVGIYGPTKAEESGAYGLRHVAVQSGVRPPLRAQRRFSTDAILAIDTDRVLEACDRMVNNLRGIPSQTHAA